IARRGDHRPDLGEVDAVDTAGVRGARVGRDDLGAQRGDRRVDVAAAPRAEHSVAMLASVARSSGDSANRPSPPNSITRLSVSSRFAYVARMWSITSLAVVPGGSAPVSSKRIASGTASGVNP